MGCRRQYATLGRITGNVDIREQATDLADMQELI